MPFKTVSTAPYTPNTTNDSTGHNGAVAAFGTAINIHTHDPSDANGNYGNSVPAWGGSNPLYSMHGPGGGGVGNDWASSYNGTAAIPADPSEIAVNPSTNVLLSQATPAATITQSWGIHGELARVRGAIALMKNGNWFDAVTMYADPLSAVGDLVYRNVSNATTRLPIGSSGQTLQVVSGVPTWANNPAGFTDPTTTPGDLIYKDGTNTTNRLGVGPNGYIMQVVSGLPTWQSAASVAAAAATTTTLGSVVLDQNPASGNPIAITKAGYLSSVTGLTTSNLAAAAGITSAQIASVAASTMTGTLTKAQQYATTAYTDAANTFTGINTVQALIASGLTGATAASRYVGATISGAPASGTFLKGDWVVDQTGKIWVCSTAGSPGTWTQTGGSSAFSWQDTAGAVVEPMPRWNTFGGGATLNLVYFTYFTATVSQTVTTASMFPIAAKTDATLVKIGLYSVDASDNLTLLGATASTPSLVNAANALKEAALTASVTLTAGNRYAAALLVVGGASAAQILTTNAGQGSSAPMARLSSFYPAIFTTVAGTDLPAAPTYASMAASYQSPWLGFH